MIPDYLLLISSSPISQTSTAALSVSYTFDEIWLNFLMPVQKRVNLVDLVKSFETSSFHNLLAKFGFDTAENEPLKVCQKIAKRL